MPTQSQTETAPIVKSAQDLYEIVKGTLSLQQRSCRNRATP